MRIPFWTVVSLLAFGLPSPPAAQCSWVPDQTLVPSQAGLPQHYFARSVSLEGTRVLIGAPGLASEPGKAFVFEFDGSLWAEVTSFDSGQGLESDDFGRSVALSGDTALVGAPEADGGAAYVFERVGGDWIQTAELHAPTSEGEFGESVDLQGDRAVIAAPDAGQVFVFERTGSVWSAAAILEPPTPAPEFGEDVHLDGDRIAVGAPDAGSAYVYAFDGALWAPELVLDGFPDEKFATSVSLEGDVLMIGAPGWSSEAGRVHTYGRYASEWVSTGILSPSVAANDARFGETIAHDLNKALIGAPADGEGFGSTFLFERLGTHWIESQKFEPDLAVNEFNFGTAIAVDQGTAMVNVGVDQAGVLGAQYAGSLYVYGAVASTCPGLVAYPGWISVSAGGAQLLSFETDPSHALDPYLILGSISGTSPGVPIANGVLPLNPDAYLVSTVAGANGPSLVGTFGLLSGGGAGSASIVVPPGSPVAWAGLKLHHAFVVLDPATLSPIASDNAVLLELVP